ncbi:MAG: DNA glycosylase [Lachnospiraceae bacterium]|nr:DNA glycosylase [Lachnospiraceae bacterium]MDD3615111.1 DNA glycosylase [Lachnospiraceae bacterium]
MIKKTLQNFNISQICDSGECFRMRAIGEHTYSLIAGSRYLEITQTDESCSFSCDESEFEEFWKRYFDLDTDYAAYISRINPNDSYLVQASEAGYGVRILRQDLWETIVSFLISQQNNIVRIRKCIQNICEKYGEEKKNFKGETYYAFPTPQSLANQDEDALKECNLGYRSKYVVRTARYFTDNPGKLEEITKLSYLKAKEELLTLFGVGIKVAECICLFSLHHLQAFPIDTHIKQALDQHYKRGFPKRRYKGFEGVIQQYIFYYELIS